MGQEEGVEEIWKKARYWAALLASVTPVFKDYKPFCHYVGFSGGCEVRVFPSFTLPLFSSLLFIFFWVFLGCFCVLFCLAVDALSTFSIYRFYSESEKKLSCLNLFSIL